MARSPEETLSRALSKTLRHAAKSQGIPQDSNGWCLLTDLLSHAPYTNMKVGKEQIFEAVSKDKKGRYELDENKERIRAVQGHSVEVELDLIKLDTEEKLPPIIVHGTNKRAYEIIKTEGLKKMKRQYIHMASNLPQSGEVISGMRQNCSVHVYIDGPKALKEGIQFFKSKNGVILSPDVIPPELFARVDVK